MRLVCIMGIDGTGKTTLARNAVAALQAQGTPAAYVYGRTVPMLSRLLMALGRAILLREHDLWQNYPAYAASKKQVSRRRALAWPYAASIWLDYYVQIWLKLLPHLSSQRVVVLDRYLYDTVINELAVQLDYSPGQTEQAIERGLRLLPTPSLALLLDLPEEVAFSRKNDVPHVEYLRERRGRYLELSARPEVHRLDAGGTPQDLLEAALKSFADQCNGGGTQ